MRSALNRILSPVIDLIYPPRCPFCDSIVERRDCPCRGCGGKLVPLPGDANVVLDVRTWLSRARSCFAYEGPAMDLVRSLKYSARLDLVRYCARRLHKGMEGLGEHDSIVTVPIDSGRVVKRGHDHCALIAGQLARMSGIRYLRGALARVRSIPPQVGLPRDEREKNVRGAFGVDRRKEAPIAGRRILVIDDVLTTGATLNDCARALLKAGAREVRALTLARTL
jgi:competence protein ComFC